MEGAIIIIPFFIGIALMFRVMAGALDHSRIRHYVRSRGGRIISIRWAPFGPGWFGEKSDRIYYVRYADKSGNGHAAHCKTSMWTGVYFTADRIVHQAALDEPIVPQSQQTLEAENRQLRQEWEWLRRQHGG